MDNPNLTSDDLRILKALSRGRPVDSVARELRLSERTVRRRVRRICDAVGAATPIEAVVWAVRRGRI